MTRLVRMVGTIATLITLMVSAQATPASAAPILWATGTGDASGVGGLYEVDPHTGLATRRWTFNAFVHAGGLAYDSVADTLFMTGYDDASLASLWTVDRFTGGIAFIGHTGGGSLEHGGLAIDPATGVMYATGLNPPAGNSALFSINKTTGAATLIGQNDGALNCNIVNGLGFGPGGALLGNGMTSCNPAASQLFSVAPGSGAIVDIGPHGVSLGRQLNYSGLALSSGGVLYSLGSVSASQSGLYSVNPLTGAATLIGSGFANPQFGVDGGLVFAPDQAGTPVPEPASLVLLGTGLVAATARRRFRKRT